ncbi:MAG: hypothetical protein V4696_04215 [Pseudomonadota bacterium]
MKKEALRRAGIGYHEVVAGVTTRAELKRLVERLVVEGGGGLISAVTVITVIVAVMQISQNLVLTASPMQRAVFWVALPRQNRRSLKFGLESVPVLCYSKAY